MYKNAIILMVTIFSKKKYIISIFRIREYLLFLSGMKTIIHVHYSIQGIEFLVKLITEV